MIRALTHATLDAITIALALWTVYGALWCIFGSWSW